MTHYKRLVRQQLNPVQNRDTNTCSRKVSSSVEPKYSASKKITITERRTILQTTKFYV